MPGRSISRQVKGSQIVTSRAQVDLLAKYLVVPPHQLRLTTLFTTAADGWSPSTFHAKCDSQGATLTVIKCGKMFHGGYASVSWNSNGSYLADPKAFLFRFTCDQRGDVTVDEKFERNNSGNEVMATANYGPVFGYKHDLFTFGSNHQALSDVHHGGRASFKIPDTLFYDTNARVASSSIVEVLSVAIDHSIAEEFEESWVPGLSWNAESVEKMESKVFEYDPVDAGLSVPLINILLCGGVGAGKSSIISTVDSICKGRTSRVAPHGQGTGSLTSMLRKYAFKQPNSTDPVKWQLWDTMGWGVDDYKRGELGFILDGNLPNKCDLSKPISTRTEGFKTNPHLKDRVHCVILVVPCNAATDEAYMTRLNEMRQFAREREIPTLIFLSKIDAYDPDIIGADLSKTFHSARLLHLIEELEETSGVGGRKDILPVKSLSKEAGPTTELTLLMCRALEQALYAAEDYVTEYEGAATLRRELSD